MQRAKVDTRKQVKRDANAQFSYVLEYHVHIIVKSSQRPDNFLVAAHDDPHFRADAFVDEFCGRGTNVSEDISLGVPRSGNSPRGKTCDIA